MHENDVTKFNNMKKLLLLAAVAMVSFSAAAQPKDADNKEAEDGFKFETVKANPITSVKDQASSGTCWCFSAVGMLESEMIRQGCTDEDLDLSEMFLVSNAYLDKAIKYVRVDGNLNYNQGSSCKDVLHIIKDHGVVPNEVMPGLNYGTTRHAHSELVAVLRGFMEAIVKVPNKVLSPAWPEALKGILAAYLGEVPETFTYKGKEYTPKSYLESLPINLDDYIQFTSWTHIPYYKESPVEVADNWRWDSAWNLPLDEFMAVIDNAINKGYTIAWGADVSEDGFTRDGIGLALDMEAVNAPGSDQAHWLGTLPNGRKTINGPVAEVTVTPELRQKGYEEKSTTDDHGMQIYGIAKDCQGNKYYMVKNSWGITGKYSGIWYISETYIKYKSMDMLVHKDAVPKEIMKKLGLK